MLIYTHYLNFTLGLFSIILQFFSVLALAFLFFGPRENKFLFFIKEHFLIIGFIISFFAVLFSLFYSEIVGFLPCKLCWFQRVFLFSQVVLFGMAYVKKDRKVARYSFPLLAAGFFITLYHIFIYYFAEELASCDPSGISCTQRLIDEFGGYISFPMFALTSFIGLMTILVVARFYKKQKESNVYL
ncbi:disulfide bond formation protein B [Patescibacteria group bacterium]|nr:disulfide bond formation protein B [Patescibacteria group bacterium]MBU1728006.1 disulfide bond formation protein B [Patescibacteria group bacterium]